MILNGSVAIYASRDEIEIKKEMTLHRAMLEKTSTARATVAQGQVIKLSVLCPEFVTLYPHVVGLREKRYIEYSPDFLRKELKYFDQRLQISPEAKIFDHNTGILRFTFIATLAEGAIFGEKGLDESTPRTATVVSITDCDLGYLLKVDYDNILKDINRADTERRKAFFNQLVFRNSITAVIALRLSYDFYKKKSVVTRGMILREQGKRGKMIYVVRRGQVCVEKTEIVASTPPKGLDSLGNLVAPKQTQKTFVVSYLGEGELIGEEVFFETGASDYTIRVSSTEATIMEVTVECLKTYLKIEKKVTEFLDNLYTLRKKQWAEVLTKMRESVFLISNQAEAMKRVKILPQITKPVVNCATFDEKYDNELSKFLIDKVEYRMPYLVRQNDRENCVEIDPETLKDIWICKEPRTEHYLEQDKLLRELDKQGWIRKHGRRLRITKKFNQVLRDQVLKNASLLTQSVERKRRPFNSSSETSIIDSLNKKVNHNRSELDLCRSEEARSTSLVCRSSRVPAKLDKISLAAVKSPHTQSAASVLQFTKYDNCGDTLDSVVGHTEDTSGILASEEAGRLSSQNSSQVACILFDSSSIGESRRHSSSRPRIDLRLAKQSAYMRKNRLIT